MSNAITDLLAALSQVLIIIAIGFGSAKIKIIPPGAAPGIGLIVGTFALPALFLLNAASMDIASFDVKVLVGVLLARYCIIGVAIGTSRLLDPNAQNTKGVMGLYALFCTQSNDVAIGLPIVQAIYPVTAYPANYPGYLIILSTLQVCLVNPVCIMLLEWGKSEMVKVEDTEEEGSEKKQHSIGLKVLKGVATSPLVLGSVVGVVINLSLGRDCLTSGVAGDTLTVVGHAFTFCALFLTGMSMDAKTSPSPDTSDIQLPPVQEPSQALNITALVLGKSLIHPIAIRLVLSLINPNPTGDLKNVHDFAYLYGTLPVASLPVVLANQNQIRPAMIAIASVASTFVSMPLLLVSAAIFLNVESESIYDATRILSKVVCVFSIITLTGLILVYRKSFGVQVIPMTVILNLGISQWLFHASLLGCEFATGNEGGTYIVYWISFYLRTAMNTWLSNLALYFLLLVRSNYREPEPVRMWILSVCGWFFPVVLCVIGYAVGHNGVTADMQSYHVLCWYQTTNQVYPDLGLTLLYFLTFTAVFALERTFKQQADSPETLLDGTGIKADTLLDYPEAGYSEEKLSAAILISYSDRVKVILAVGFMRLLLVATLQLQMLSGVNPDGSFNVQMLFAVLLVDGGGTVTALAFLINNPLLNSTLKAMRTFFGNMCLTHGDGSEVPWLGQDEPTVLPKPDHASTWYAGRHSLPSGESADQAGYRRQPHTEGERPHVSHVDGCSSSLIPDSATCAPTPSTRRESVPEYCRH